MDGNEFACFNLFLLCFGDGLWAGKFAFINAVIETELPASECIKGEMSTRQLLGSKLLEVTV